MLVTADLHMAGYTRDQLPPMQKCLLDTVAAIPGVESVGLTDALLLNDSDVFTDETTDLRPANAVTNSYVYHISPEYLHAEGTTLQSGRHFTWHDDQNSPRVAVVNQQFARKIFGSVETAIGGYYKMPDGTRIQVVGVAEDGKYGSLTAEPHAAVSPFCSGPTVMACKPGIFRRKGTKMPFGGKPRHFELWCNLMHRSRI